MLILASKLARPRGASGFGNGGAAYYGSGDGDGVGVGDGRSSYIRFGDGLVASGHGDGLVASGHGDGDGGTPRFTPFGLVHVIVLAAARSLRC